MIAAGTPEAQAASAVLMVRPHRFSYNADTATSNAFQLAASADSAVNDLAITEFNGAVHVLRDSGIEVVVVDASANEELPDAIFPNNWISTHADGTVVLYPLRHESRRRERRRDYVELLARTYGFEVSRTIDLSGLEDQEQFVEGTGSLVLDRPHRIAYACRSPRTTDDAVDVVTSVLGYRACIFDALDESGRTIYHTNVMMSVCSSVAVVCLETVRREADRFRLVESLRDNGKTPLEISEVQMRAFAGNVIELKGRHGSILAISRRAWSALTKAQKQCLEGALAIAPVAVDAIEDAGGGGIRCMVAEIHLPRRNQFDRLR